MSSSAAHGTLDVAGRRTRWWRGGTLDGRPLVLLAHGAGAACTSPFMDAVARGLVARDLAVARFHFPYMQRSVDEERRRPPDPMPVLQATFASLLEKVAGWSGAGPVVLAGKSMGGRVASMLLAAGRAPGARAAVYFGYPLHPPGRPERLRSEHLPAVRVRQLFVSGTRDSLARIDLLEACVEGLGRSASLYSVAGGDHSLAVTRRDPLAGSAAWLDAAATFVRRACA